jgi:hypothetical protein
MVNITKKQNLLDYFKIKALKEAIQELWKNLSAPFTK